MDTLFILPFITQSHSVITSYAVMRLDIKVLIFKSKKISFEILSLSEMTHLFMVGRDWFTRTHILAQHQV